MHDISIRIWFCGHGVDGFELGTPVEFIQCPVIQLYVLVSLAVGSKTTMLQQAGQMV